MGELRDYLEQSPKEIEFCNNDLEVFKMRYNHLRPHNSLNNKTPAEEFCNFERKLRL